MPDEIDRDQAFNERCLEALIEQSRLRPTPTPSLAALSILRQGYSGKTPSDAAGCNNLY